MDLFIKIYNVIHSCNTEKQLVVALRYLDTAWERGFIPEQFRNAIYFSVYLDKFEEIST